MISLVIDTCTSNLIIALCKDNKIVSELVKKNDTNLSTEFTALVQNIIRQANLSIDMIDAIFISTGPGSFTGIRVGLTFAKVLGWSKQIKVIPFSSLELLASGASNNVIVPILDARRGFVYAGIYDNNLNIIMDNSYIELGCLRELIKAYDDVEFVSCDSFNFDIESPVYDIVKVVEKHKDDNGVNPHTLVPDYLKKTEAEEKLGN